MRKEDQQILEGAYLAGFEPSDNATKAEELAQAIEFLTTKELLS